MIRTWYGKISLEIKSSRWEGKILRMHLNLTGKKLLEKTK